MVDGAKVCCACSVSKPVADYSKRSGRQSGVASMCRDCCRWNAVLKNYGLTRDLLATAISYVYNPPAAMERGR